MASIVRARILNGALAGREIALPDGELSMGGTESDLAIMLEHGVATTLRADETGWHLDPPVPCWLEGKPAMPGHILPLGVAVDVAGCGIALGTAGMALDKLSLPPRYQERRAAFWMWPLFLSISLLGLLFGAIATGMAMSDEQKKSRQVRQAAIRQLADEFRQAGVDMRADPGGNMFYLLGSCLSSAAIEPLRARLRDHKIAFHDKLVCRDDLLTLVRNTLSLHGYQHVQVTQGDAPDTVHIVGAIAGDAKWQKTAKMLSLLPGLAHWSVQDSGSQHARDLVARLRDAGLLKRLSVVRSDNALLVTGQLAPHEVAAFERISAALIAESAGPLRIIHQNVASHPAQTDFLPAPIVSFGSNERSVYLILANQMRLFVGSKLANGYEVVTIDEQGVDLLKQDELIHLPLSI